MIHRFSPRLIQLSVAIFQAISIFISYRAWFLTESILRAPILNFAQAIPVLSSLILVFPFLFSLKKDRSPILLSIYTILSIFLVLLDQTLIQPWWYQYTLLIFITEFLKGSKYSQKILKYFLSSIYFFSGLLKLNHTFFTKMFPWVMEPLLEIHSPYLGASAAVIEILIAVLLLINSFRYIAVSLAACTHLLILLAIGPTGRSWNMVVWPWNIAMMTFLILVFLPKEKLKLPRKSLVLSVLLFSLPLLNYADIWDSHLSFSLYSAKKKMSRYIISIEDSDILKLNEKYLNYHPGGAYQIDLSKVSLETREIPIPPEKRIFKTIFHRLCDKLKYPQNAELVIYTPQSLLKTEFKQESIFCIKN